MFLVVEFLPRGNLVSELSSPDHLEIMADSKLHCEMEMLVLYLCGEIGYTRRKVV